MNSIALVAPDGTQTVEIQRPLGDLDDYENASDGLNVGGFGIDVNGNPYFDTERADPDGQAKVLVLAGQCQLLGAVPGSSVGQMRIGRALPPVVPTYKPARLGRVGRAGDATSSARAARIGRALPALLARRPSGRVGRAVPTLRARRPSGRLGRAFQPAVLSRAPSGRLGRAVPRDRA